MDAVDRLRPYVAGLAVDWLQTTPNARHRYVDGSLAFVDISGFTALTERLAAKGKAGAEELATVLDQTFAALLAEAYSYGALLVKWGGDAVLLLFEGPDHERLATRAAWEMRARMATIGKLRTSVGRVTLRMSVGVHSGRFDFFMLGNRHHELVVSGPAATVTAALEGTAEAGEIVVGEATARALPPDCLGERKGDGVLVRNAPDVDPRCRFWPRLSEAFDFGSCLDPAVGDYLLQGVVDPEHRWIGVAFIQVTGVDASLQRRGPDATADDLHRLMDIVQQEAARHRVTFWETDISADGLKVLLVAGVPATTGHDEGGLLRAARAILDGYAADGESGGDNQLGVRIGANCGRAFTGDFGPSFRRTLSVKADAVNLAARITAKASPGELFATADLLERSAATFDTEPLPPFPVKGKKIPVNAARVGAARLNQNLNNGNEKYVGRAAELTRLRQLATDAGNGRGTAVRITGEPGIGKTRLVAEALDTAGTTTLRSAADDYESATPYFAIRRLLLAALGLAADAQRDDILTTVHRLLITGAPQLIPWVPMLVAPLGLGLSDSDVTASVTEDFRQQRIAALAVELLTLTNPGRTFVVVDDAQWLDDASAEVLARLATEAKNRPWLIVTASRRADGPDAAQHIDLGPLSNDETAELVRDAAGTTLVASRRIDAVVARANGNPLFATQLIAATLAAGESDDGELPVSLEEVLAAQIDELPPRARRLLRTASVLGTRVDAALLPRLLQADAVPADDLARIERFMQNGDDHTWTFRSSLLRDAAYAGLAFRRRRELHGLAADALVSRHGDNADEYAEALSLHFSVAQRYAEAWHYSRRAGADARKLGANAEALTFYGRARAAARWLPDLPPAEVALLLETTGDLHAKLAELEPATAAYREARRIAPRTDTATRARVAIAAALASTRAGLPVRTARWLATAEQELSGETTRATQELRARIAVERALIAHRQGKHQAAAELCAEALQRGEEAGADYVVARALHILDLNDVAAGHQGDEARAMRALVLFERCGDLTRQAGMWNHLGIRAYYAGDWDAAVQRYEQARLLHDRAGDEWNAVIASANVAEIRVDQGRLTEAEPLAVEALRVWRTSGTPSDIGFGAALLGRLRARQGEWDEAFALLDEAATAYAANNERFELVDTALRVAEAWILRGATTEAGAQLDEAERALRRAVRAAGHESGERLPTALPHTAQLWLLRGYALAQDGDLVGAAATMTSSLTAARERGASYDAALALAGLQSIGALDVDGAAELLALKESLGIVWTPSTPLSKYCYADLPPAPGTR